jgi:glyoxylase-like metal-dependent hydrolase (beta-lactamase superfamily II)
MKIYKHLVVLAFGVLAFDVATAADELELQKITSKVYAIVGSLGNRTSENLGNNATFGFAVTSDGVVLIDSGGTYKGAEGLHEVIKRITDEPIVTVINTGGQDHRWLGNEYFQEQGLN